LDHRYPSLKWNGKTINAARKMAQLKFGDMEGLVTRHICNTTICINPDHILRGTVSQNSMDIAPELRRQRSEHAWKKWQIIN
jgi:hypothetical protein